MALVVDDSVLKPLAEAVAKILSVAAPGKTVTATLLVKDGKYSLALAPFGPIIEDSIQ